MKISKKELPKSIIELIVEESVAEVQKQRKKALSYIEKNADIKGFRKGVHIPENVLVRQYGAEYINKLTIDFAIDEIYKKVIQKEGLIPVAEGKIKEVISESPLKIKIHIEVLPEVVIDPKYKNIHLKKQKVSVSKQEIDTAIEDIEKRFTTFQETNDKKLEAKMGDKVTIDTHGFEGKTKLENTSMQDYPVVLGSHILVPSFEESIVGGKVGEEKQFPVEFPHDYHNKDFAGKKTQFWVQIKKIEKACKPEWNEAFIEKLRGKKLDMEGFKKLIGEEIKETKQINIQAEQERQLIEKLLEFTSIDIGDSLLARKTEEVLKEIKENLANQNIKMEQYLESLKMGEEQYKEKHVKNTALERLQGQLILNKLLEYEKPEIPETQMKEEIKKILSRFESKDVVKRLTQLYEKNNTHYDELKRRMQYKKIIESFFIEEK